MTPTDPCLTRPSPRVPGSRSGPLLGQTFVVKDLAAVEGHTPSFGHPRWRETHEPAPYHAPVVQRLLDAGATLLGTTKLDQLAFSLVGNACEGEPPVNPRQPDRFTGGSSSGSAAAVASGLAEIGVGTDTAGSTRVPAAACGLFGLRPSRGLVPDEGVIPLAPKFDTVGWFTRDAALLREVFEVLAPDAPEAADIDQILLAEHTLDGLAPALAEATRTTATALADALGVPLGTADLAFLFDPAVAEVFTRLQARQIWNQHGDWIDANIGHLDPEVAGRLRRCRRLAADSWTKRLNDELEAQDLVEDFREALQPNQAVVLPVMPQLTPLRSAKNKELLTWRSVTLRYTVPAALCGAPQVALPDGVGLLGARHADRALLGVLAP
jgi:amidase